MAGGLRAATFAPHDATNNVSCASCHVLHNSPGPSLTRYDTITNLCKSCHYEAGPGPNAETHQNQNCTVCHAHTQEQNDTYGSTYGKFIKTQIVTPNSGSKGVRFMGPTTLADGDATYDGVCEVCHTQTNYHRNTAAGDHSHNVGANCTQCHQHVDGFAPGMGGGAHPTHITPLSGPKLQCTSCHGTNSPPTLADGQNLANTTVCDNCHSPNDIATAKSYWSQNPGAWATAEGEAGLCGSCHDATPGNSKPDGTGNPAANVMGDETTYGFTMTGHGKPSGNYARLAWQDTSASGNPAANQACSACHDLTTRHFGATGKRLKAGYEDDANNSNCRQCHESAAVADPDYYANYTAYQGSAHSGQKCSTCHDVHGMSGPYVAMTKADRQNLCYQCHTDGIIQNVALSGSALADDIQQAFSMAERHDLGTAFSVDGKTYSLECTSCHNVHVVTGKHWDVAQGKSPVTRFPGNPDGVAVTEVWGDNPGEKMDSYAAKASGTGGWYYSVARGRVLASDQPAVYQPPKTGTGTYEFDGDVLPDYATFCLDCHRAGMPGTGGPVNWGSGAPHGLTSANKPYYWGDVGMYGASGNPDPIFQQPDVTRGRGAGHFMRWPYDSVHKNAGINFVLSCTDCHESHGSPNGSMLRSVVNNGSGSTTWNVMCNNCHYYYGGQHAGMSCGNASCHTQNSIHRIDNNGGSSPGTFLWTEPSRPTTTPEISTVHTKLGSNQLEVTFTQGVWTNPDQTGSLIPGDFLLTDTGGDHPRTITSISHTAGSATAILTLSATTIASDASDLLATLGMTVWDTDGEPAGPWTVNLGIYPGSSAFELNETAGSTTVTDTSGLITGTVYGTGALPGDGTFHGDGANTYIQFTDSDASLQSPSALTIELRIKPTGLSGTGAYVRRVLARDIGGNYQISVWRNNSWATYDAPADTASIAFWLRPTDAHGGKAWKLILTEYTNFPIVSDHWYRVKVVWNSNKTGGIPGDIFIDDEGTDGNGTGENWVGYKNATNASQSLLPTDRYLQQGDTILTKDTDFVIGANANNLAKNIFQGQIDWIRWQRAVDYTGVDDTPIPPQ